MKKFGITILFAAILAFAAQATGNPFGDGVVDLEKSSVEWTGKKVTGKHHGTIQLKEASIEMNADGMLSGGSFVIDMTTLANTDLAGKEMQPKLEGHLKSADFFNIEEHPTASLEITKVIHRGTEGSYKVIGDLTIKGTSKPVKFNAQFGEEGGMKVATAEIEVDRSEYDVRYGSGSFFENLGDKTIYDEFMINVKLVLK